MQHHSMKLVDYGFDEIKAGRKQVEIRLYDEKRQKIHVGDVITFRKLPDLQDEITVEVTALDRYPDFASLV